MIELKKREVKVVNIIVIDGKEVRYDDLPEEKKREIGIELSRRFMTTLGYEEVKT